MNERVKAFFEFAKSDPELSNTFTKMTLEELLAAAKAKGIELTAEDFAPAEGELDDAEQDNIAGGSGGCICSFAGGGGGTDINDGNTYGCACVYMGQGGDGHLKDVNCYCAGAGVGNEVGLF